MSVSRVGVLVMVCCVSGGSCDSPNVGVIYTPPNKQASLRRTVNAKPGPSAPKVEPGDPRRPLRGSQESRVGVKRESLTLVSLRSGRRLQSERERAAGGFEPPLSCFHGAMRHGRNRLLEFSDRTNRDVKHIEGEQLRSTCW